jgi:hypothetical protein
MAFNSAPVFLMGDIHIVRTFIHRLVEEELPPRSARGDARERVRDTGEGDDIFTIAWEIQDEGRPWGTIFSTEGIPHTHDHVIAVRFTCHIEHAPLREYGDWVLRSALGMFEEVPNLLRVPAAPPAGPPPPPATAKEEVERLRRGGKGNADIAELLGLAEKTVANYVTDINKRLRAEKLPPLS